MDVFPRAAQGVGFAMILRTLLRHWAEGSRNQFLGRHNLSTKASLYVCDSASTLRFVYKHTIYNDMPTSKHRRNDHSTFYL